MALKKWLLLVTTVLFSLSTVVSCTAHPTTPSPSYTPSETTPVFPTPSYTLPPLITHPIIKPTTTPTPNYTPSVAIQERLHEEAQVFGRDIPIPTYLPEGYAITDAQFIQQQYSYDHLELTIAAIGKTDIIMQITWYHGGFRILPTSDNYALFDISGGPGTYSKWAMFNYHSDQNDLDWDWVPETFPPNSTSPIAYYEIILSASTEVPVEELVNIARFVRVLIIPTSFYTPSEAIKAKLQEIAQAFGRDIPIPTYLPEGYAISDAQFIQHDNVELTLAAPGKADIIMSITWFRGVFRLLPPSDNYQYFTFSDGNGTYDSVVLAYYSDHNALWWDWVPETLSLNDPRPQEYYEMVLSADTSVPVAELVDVARFVRIP